MRLLSNDQHLMQALTTFPENPGFALFVTVGIWAVAGIVFYLWITY